MSKHPITPAQSDAIARYREWHQRKGLCRTCPEPRAEMNNTFCERHAAKERERAKRRYKARGMV